MSPVRSAADWLSVRDPGWGQAQMAWRTLVGLVAGMATGYFVAPALGLPTLLGLTFGGLLGLLPGLLVADAPAGELASSLAWYLPSFALGELLGIWLAPHQGRAVVNTVALVFDGRLGGDGVDSRYAEYLHRGVFDVEDALMSLADVVLALSVEQAPEAQAVAAAQMRALAAGRPVDGASLRATADLARTLNALHDLDRCLISIGAGEPSLAREPGYPSLVAGCLVSGGRGSVLAHDEVAVAEGGGADDDDRQCGRLAR
jgi:hypothetical protein